LSLLRLTADSRLDWLCRKPTPTAGPKHRGRPVPELFSPRYRSPALGLISLLLTVYSRSSPCRTCRAARHVWPATSASGHHASMSSNTAAPRKTALLIPAWLSPAAPDRLDCSSGPSPGSSAAIREAS